MNIIALCVKRPVGVSVGVLLVLLFGSLALTQMPVQLTPTVDVPIVTITTRWFGASPQEIEREIVERQEEELRNVQGLKEMKSVARYNEAEITLEFYPDISRDAAIREADNRLGQVSEYPVDAEEPVLAAADTARDNEIAWLILHTRDGDDARAPELFDFAEDFIQPRLDRVPGVGSTDIYGGMQREVQVLVDAANLAARGLTFEQVATALRRQNTNVSAGAVSEGKRDFTVRTLGQYENIEQVLNTVVADTAGGPVYIRDVADVQHGFRKQYGFVRSKGQYVLAFPVRRQTGANVIKTMEGLRTAIAAINREVLSTPHQGLKLELVQVYDETVYIDQAIAMVRTNMMIGGALAIVVLLVFLRSWRPTLVVALAIPIAVVGTLVVVWGLGRTINVISLAGLAFAVGMIVDNAIVVLENIYRHYEMGKRPVQAAMDGASEVWGAVLASTLTTMAVFIPVILVQQEAGQLFRDISIATVAAVGLSLMVALTVVPTMAARFLSRRQNRSTIASHDQAHEAHGLARHASRFIGGIVRQPVLRVFVIAFMISASFALLPFLLPETTYLPKGNRNLVFGVLLTPPGYATDEYRRMGATVESVVAPYWRAGGKDPNVDIETLQAEWSEIAQGMLASGGVRELAGPEPPWWNLTARLQRDRIRREWLTPPPPIAHFFFVTFNGGAFMGARSADDARVRPVANLLTVAAGKIPGVFGFFQQTSIFGRRIGGGSSVEIRVQSDSLEAVTQAAGAVMGATMQKYGFVQPDPQNFALGRPELQIVPDRERAAELGLTVLDVGLVVEAAVEGAYVGDFRFEGGDTIDISLLVQGRDNRSTPEIAETPIYSSRGGIVPLSAAVQQVSTSALDQINRLERQRAVTLTVNPSDAISLEAVINDITNDIVPSLREAGAIPPNVTVSLAGNADKLVEARNTMIGEWEGFTLASLLNIGASRFFLSVLIVYLLMAALYESWVYPFVIMFSVPLAIFGGFLGLKLCYLGTLMTTSQQIQLLDVVTFLGFVILVGIVVNNAILLVDQALRNVRIHGLEHDEAVRQAIAARIRPILMTTMTTIAGQAPLVFIPGAGSELYRGLASVMLGGLLVATLGTLLLVPSVLSLVFAIQRALGAAPAATTAGGSGAPAITHDR